jgi:hypothetical protein
MTHQSNGRAMSADDFPYIDLGTAQEFTVMECSEVERIGPLTRLTFTIPARIDKRNTRLVVTKLLIPTEMIPAIAKMVGTRKALPHSGDEVTLQ